MIPEFNVSLRLEDERGLVLTAGPTEEEGAAEVAENDPTAPTTVPLGAIEPEGVGETVRMRVSVLCSVIKLLAVSDPGM